MNTAVLIALAGLIVSIIGAAWKLCVTVTEATDAVKALTQRIDRLDDDNAKDHTEMWDKIEHSEDTLNDHETRISLLEHEHKE